MPDTLTPSEIEEIRKLVHLGFSQPQIVRRTGRSSATIYRYVKQIKQEQRRHYAAIRQQRNSGVCEEANQDNEQSYGDSEGYETC